MSTKGNNQFTFDFAFYFSVALNTAFGSLYCDEVVITPATVVPLIAAAHLLQLVRIWSGFLMKQRLASQVQTVSKGLKLLRSLLT